MILAHRKQMLRSDACRSVGVSSGESSNAGASGGCTLDTGVKEANHASSSAPALEVDRTFITTIPLGWKYQRWTIGSPIGTRRWGLDRRVHVRHGHADDCRQLLSVDKYSTPRFMPKQAIP